MFENISNNLELKKAKKIVNEINNLKEKYSKMSDEELKSQTNILKNKLKDGLTLDDILVEAFAVCRESSKRVLDMEHFDVQLIGGYVLHNGNISEMRTGEGKTLVATLPAYLNALTGEGVHIVTVNEYLAKRDSEWMGKLYKWLGLTCGFIGNNITNEEKREIYKMDIVYTTNSELGFDYLRDNMVKDISFKVQKNLNYAIIDEVDSILIDEARTPHIISQVSNESNDFYNKVNEFVKTLGNREWKPKLIFENTAKEKQDGFTNGLVEKDEKSKTICLSEEGIKLAESFFGIDNLGDIEHTNLNNHIYQSLKAHFLMKKDVDYIIKDNQIQIIDEFTGRILPGRIYSDGLHQAIEAKENIEVQKESETLASITLQNYFRLYKKIAGMTGTAKTEEAEFVKIYNMKVLTIPTNKPNRRKDLDDIILCDKEIKNKLIINDIIEKYNIGRPVLVGTTNIETNEIISKLLNKHGIPHKILNAKHHEEEAEIIAQAGRFKAITVATNMAGRGTDIILGGNYEGLALTELCELFGRDKRHIAQHYSEYSELPENIKENLTEEDFKTLINKYVELLREYKAISEEERKKVINAGGLYVIGTEKHESRRIDNQLRGRSGRQGDSGETIFYVSLEDDLMRIFGGDRLRSIIQTFNFDRNTPISNFTITKLINKAQKQLESNNFAIRKDVLEYDDVINEQRKIIYNQRNDLLTKNNIQLIIKDMYKSLIADLVNEYFLENEENIEIKNEGILKVTDTIEQLTGIRVNLDNVKVTKEIFIEQILNETNIENKFTEENFDLKAKNTLLNYVDKYWIDYVESMEEIKEGIHLRGYANELPIITYIKKSYEVFDYYMNKIKSDFINKIFIH